MPVKRRELIAFAGRIGPPIIAPGPGTQPHLRAHSSPMARSIWQAFKVPARALILLNGEIRCSSHLPTRAITSDRQSAPAGVLSQSPDALLVPTIAEAALRVTSLRMVCVLARAGTPQVIIDRSPGNQPVPASLTAESGIALSDEIRGARRTFANF